MPGASNSPNICQGAMCARWACPHAQEGVLQLCLTLHFLLVQIHLVRDES